MNRSFSIVEREDRGTRISRAVADRVSSGEGSASAGTPNVVRAKASDGGKSCLITTSPPMQEPKQYRTSTQAVHEPAPAPSVAVAISVSSVWPVSSAEAQMYAPDRSVITFTISISNTTPTRPTSAVTRGMARMPVPSAVDMQLKQTTRSGAAPSVVEGSRDSLDPLVCSSATPPSIAGKKNRRSGTDLEPGIGGSGLSPCTFGSEGLERS